MRKRLKDAALYVAKGLGLFHLSRMLTRQWLRILCYHGISVRDEHEFRRKLFMRSDVFARRLAILERGRYPILRLDDAVRRLQDRELPPTSVVITFDDGWQGCVEGAFRTLHERGLPATLYLTTYYAERREPVFDVLIGYLIWKTNSSRVALDGLCDGLSGEQDIGSPIARAKLADLVVDHGNESLDGPGRLALAGELAKRLDVDFDAIRARRLFELVTLDEASALGELGVDLQLHTHRHRIDLKDPAPVRREIVDNRERLAPIAKGPFTQLCYPSGVHHERVFPWLEELGIESATTTDAGLCDASSHRFALPRIVDGEDVSEIEFEAELSGLLELGRRLRGR